MKKSLAKRSKIQENSPNIEDCIKQFDEMINLLSSQTEIIKQIEKQNSIIHNKLNKLNKLIEEATTRTTNKKKKKNKSNKTKENNQHKTTKKQTPAQSRKILNRQNDRGFLIGYHGEGYAYEDLTKMECFSKIEWNGLSTNEHLPSVTLKNGNQYFIDEDCKHYDLYAEDPEQNKYYFEVKSTPDSTRGNSISRAQKRFMGDLNHTNEHFILVVVTNVFTTPIINYFLFIPGFNFVQLEINKYFKHANVTKLIHEKKENNEISAASICVDTKVSKKAKKRADRIIGNGTKKIVPKKKIIN